MMIGVSLRSIAWYVEGPTPGTLKMPSVTIEPPSRSADVDADVGHDRDQRVAQRVDADRPAGGEALRLGGPHVVGPQVLDQAGARQPRDGGEGERAQDQTGQRSG